MLPKEERETSEVEDLRPVPIRFLKLNLHFSFVCGVVLALLSTVRSSDTMLQRLGIFETLPLCIAVAFLSALVSLRTHRKMKTAARVLGCISMASSVAILATLWYPLYLFLVAAELDPWTPLEGLFHQFQRK